MFELYKQAEASKNESICKQVAQIFKRLISIDQKPDITLTLVNDDHYKNFFSCLNYLDENVDIKLNLREFFEEKSKFNNFLKIDNAEIISNINNNYRIVFLKDYIFPTFLTDRQIEELNTFLFLHNNTIICHINSIMRTKMETIDLEIEQNPSASHDFFAELFSIFKSTFGDLKMNFIQNFIEFQFHYKVTSLLIKLAHLETSESDLSSSRDPLLTKRIQVCAEILSFLCRNSQKALIDIFSFKDVQGRTFIENLPLLIRLSSIDLYKEIIDIFQIQVGLKSDAGENSFQYFLLHLLIPGIGATIRRIHIENLMMENLKFIYFAVEVFVVFFSFQMSGVTETLLGNSFIDDICEVFVKARNKIQRLIFLKYLKESITNSTAPVQINWKRVFLCFWRSYMRNGRRRSNLIHSINLAILKKIGLTTNFGILKQFVKVTKKFPAEIEKEELLMAIHSKYEQIHSKMNDPELDLTSESETSMTQEKCKFKIQESFLESETKLRGDSILTKEPEKSFSTPKSIQDLIQRLREKDIKKTRDEIDLIDLKGNITIQAQTIKITLDENLLGKRSTMDGLADPKNDN